MNLTDTNDSLEVVLAGAVATSQSKVIVDYVTHFLNAGTSIVENFLPDKQISTTNSSTPVTILNSPAVDTRRQPRRIRMKNSDTANITVTFRYNDNTVISDDFTALLAPGESAEWVDVEGWSVFDTFGAKKVTAVQNVVEPGYIDGLRPTWISPTGLGVTSGTCYIEASGRNVNFPSTINKTGLILTASTWYHIYGFLNAGVPDIEIETTLPTAPYNGSARSKTGDPTRRYFGSVRTDSSGNLYNFIVQGTLVTYRFDIATVSRVLSGGTSTTPATVSFASFVPVTSRAALFRAINTVSGNIATIYVYDDAPVPGFIVFLAADPAPSGSVFSQVYTVALSPTQTLQYAYLGGLGAGGFYLDVIGYILDR